jgi:UDPglucose--hexose-1-phosphate uridylyltransferase
MISEIRQDKVSKEWVIYSQARGSRPHDFQGPAGPPRDLPRRDEDCPFCPGNEASLDRVVLEMPGDNPHGWQTRVIPNKYPALVPRGDTRREQRGPYLAMDGYGRHEVIIDSPYHDQGLADMAPEELGTVVETYHRRYLAYHEQYPEMTPIIFRNHGRRAGTSLIHPHSQAVVTPVVPSRIRRRESRAEEHWDTMGRCVYCEVIEEELAAGERVVLDNDRFCALVPFAAKVPFEMWIIPKEHRPDFGAADAEDRAAFTHALGRVLGRLKERLGDPDYNFAIFTAARTGREQPHLHWHLLIRPRLTTLAGFEIGSGMNINPSLPEADAEFLREG